MALVVRGWAAFVALASPRPGFFFRFVGGWGVFGGAKSVGPLLLGFLFSCFRHLQHQFPRDRGRGPRYERGSRGGGWPSPLDPFSSSSNFIVDEIALLRGRPFWSRL